MGVIETAIHRHLYTDFTLLPFSKSGLKLVCNENIVYGNLKSENSQDYAQQHGLINNTDTNAKGTPTKRQVSKRQVSKCPVSKRLVSKCPVSKRQAYKTSGLQNIRFQNVQFLNLIYLLNKKFRNCHICIPI